MYSTTLELSDDDIEALADIRMRLVQIAGPLLWPELLVAIVDDYLATWDDLRPSRAPIPVWLQVQRQTETAPLRGVPEERR